MFKSYLFIKRKRFRKKVQLYRLYFSIILDLTSLIYLAVLVGYGLFAFYRAGELPAFIPQMLSFVTSALENDSYILTFIVFLPLLFLNKSLRQAGLLFSSAENLLSILPHSRKRLWKLLYLEKIMKVFIGLSLLSLGLLAISALSLKRIALLLLIVFVITMMMTVVQWKLFQLHIVWRISTLVLASSFAGVYAFTQSFTLLIVYNLLFLCLFILSLRHLHTDVDWKRVIATSDFRIWNMQLISQATKIKFKQDAQPSLWYRLNSWKEKFPYHKGVAYNRLWYIYGEKQIGLLLQVTGTLFLLLLVASYFHSIYYLISLAVAIYIQTSFFVSLFRDRLYSGLVNILPWDLEELQHTFIPWACLISMPLLVPTGFYAILHFDSLFIFYLIYTILLFNFMLQHKLQTMMQAIDQTAPNTRSFGKLAYLFFIIFLLSANYPYVLLVGYGLFFTLYVQSKRKTNDAHA